MLDIAKDGRLIIGMFGLSFLYNVMLIENLDCVMLVVHLALCEVHSAESACAQGLLQHKVIETQLAMFL